MHSDIEQKLQELREQWISQPQNRGRISMQVKVLQIGQKYPLLTTTENPFKKSKSFIDNVKEALI